MRFADRENRVDEEVEEIFNASHRDRPNFQYGGTLSARNIPRAYNQEGGIRIANGAQKSQCSSCRNGGSFGIDVEPPSGAYRTPRVERDSWWDERSTANQIHGGEMNYGTDTGYDFRAYREDRSWQPIRRPGG